MNGVSQTFFEHLEELRRRLILCLAAVGLATAVCYAFVDRLLEFLISPIRPQIGTLYFFSPAEAFTAKLQVCFVSGLLLASPLIATEAWLFITPALPERTRRRSVPFIFAISALFVGGVVFAFTAVLPAGLHFLIGQRSELVQPMLSVSSYVGFLASLLMAFGIAFNMPVFILLLSAFGILKARTLFAYQRHAVVLIFILAAILTPGPDIASQVLLALPLLGLFEASVLGAWVIGRAQKSRTPRRT